ncbi:hypothetical protein F5Y10DRAFT_284194 [Nemania abortiva]|nr:hypothetical protein F5Y10DRAFT_284194 [Nemania abortiva]
MADSRFGVPASPWAERFGAAEDTLYSLAHRDDDDLVHSNIAPVNPKLDPRYYDIVPRVDEFAPPRDSAEVDEILVTEEFQRSRYMGVTTWNIPPLNSVLSWDGAPTLLGGNRPGDDKIYDQLLGDYMSQRIEVDERTWLPFFRRNRFYNLDLGGEEDTIVESDGTKWKVGVWSVDDNRVWDVLRFSIEIANRIFIAMIRDNNQWLGTLLYGRVQLWYELYERPRPGEQYNGPGTYRILLSPDFEIAECNKYQIPFYGRAIEPDAQTRCEFILELLENLLWSFTPSAESHRGETHRITTNRYTQCISRINADLMALLCGGTISTAERCILYARQAMTLMHAIFSMRLLDGQNLSPEVHDQVFQQTMGSSGVFVEPLINLEPIGEVGRSFEAAVFGGTPWDAPPFEHEATSGVPMIVTNINYPSRYGISGQGYRVGNDPRMGHGAEIDVSFLPASLFWRLQSKTFWESTPPPNGHDGFWFPRTFTSTLFKEPGSQVQSYREYTVNPDPGGDVRFYDMARRWNEQIRLWSTRRPWHDAAISRWRMTPWGNVEMRNSIEIFLVAYKARNEARCAEIALYLEETLPRMDLRNLTPEEAVRELDHDSIDGSSTAWLFHSIGETCLSTLPQSCVKLIIPVTQAC